jgi:hypothetical protein
MIEPGHPEAICDDCGGQNVAWLAPSPVWNAVVRTANPEVADPMLCPTCFILRAEKAGMDKVWMVIPK